MEEKTEKPERLKDYNATGLGRGPVDVPFLMLVLLLFLIGLIAVLSSSYIRALYTEDKATYFFIRQLLLGAAGIGAMFVVSTLPMKFWRNVSWIIYLASVVLLVLVAVAGSRVNGARRWFSIAGVSFQPSEIAKMGVILLESSMICKYGRKGMQTFNYGVVRFALVVLVVDALLMMEPHLSASIIVFLITAVLMWVGGTRKRWFLVVGLVGAIAFVAFITLFTYQSDRIAAWRDPFADLTGKGYQIVQSLYAIGSGGLTGLGLGNSRQKNLYLPEEHNDYIFAVWAEEAGFIGAVLVLILFALLICRGYYLALHSPDKYSFLVCVGITSLLAIQVILNISVVTNTIPSTGISLPFFSYGGTALIIQLAEMGMILSVSRDIPYEKRVRQRKGQITSFNGGENS